MNNQQTAQENMNKPDQLNKKLSKEWALRLWSTTERQSRLTILGKC